MLSAWLQISSKRRRLIGLSIAAVAVAALGSASPALRMAHVRAFVAPQLIATAQSHPQQIFRVIVQGTRSAPGGGYGHGTFVAGIAAGSAPGYAGATPTAPLVSIDVMNDEGMALTSDVIAACDWIVAHKAQYNIRVANFSLHSTAAASIFWDPLDKAVEKLWFDGVVVVTASGNYGVNGQPTTIAYAP